MDIQSSVEDLSSVKKKLVVEIPVEATQGEYNRIAREYGRQARIPGFRRGKAPLALVKRHYAEELRSQLLNTLIPDSYEKVIEQHKLKPLGQPRLADIQFETDEPLRYSAEIEILPELELPTYKGLKITIEKHQVTPEIVEKELQKLQEQNSILEPVEGRNIQDGDYALVDLQGDFIVEGEAPPGTPDPIKEENLTVEVGAENTHQAFSEALRGMASEREKEFDVDYPEDYPDQKLAGRKVHFKIRVNDVKKRVLPDLTDEFAKDLGEYESLEELQSQLKADLEARLEKNRESDVRNRVVEELVAACPFEVPEVLIEDAVDERIRRFARSIASQGVNPMTAEIDWVRFRSDVRPAAVKDVKADLVLNRIAETEQISVSDDERDQEIESLARDMGRTTEAVLESLRQEKRLEGLTEHIRRRKTLDLLAEAAKIKEVTPGKATAGA